MSFGLSLVAPTPLLKTRVWYMLHEYPNWCHQSECSTFNLLASENDSKSTTKMKETWELMDREQQRLVLFGKSFSDITDVPPNTAYK